MQNDERQRPMHLSAIAGSVFRVAMLASVLALMPGVALAQGTDVQRMIDNNNRNLDDLSRSQTYQRERILDNTSIRRQLENSRDNEAIGRPRLPNCPPNAVGC